MNAIRYIFQALVCLAEIAGIVGGAIAISRRKNLVGWLAIAGFLLLGLNLMINLGLELSRTYVVTHLINTLWISSCIAAPSAFIGVICLVIAIFSASHASKTKPDVVERLEG
jgi:hypothetical protein